MLQYMPELVWIHATLTPMLILTTVSVPCKLALTTADEFPSYVAATFTGPLAEMSFPLPIVALVSAMITFTATAAEPLLLRLPPHDHFDHASALEVTPSCESAVTVTAPGLERFTFAWSTICVQGLRKELAHETAVERSPRTHPGRRRSP